MRANDTVQVLTEQGWLLMSEDKQWKAENRSTEVGVCLRFRRSLWHSNLYVGLYRSSQRPYAVASCAHCTCHSSAARRLTFLLAHSPAENWVCGLCCILHHSGSVSGYH